MSNQPQPTPTTGKGSKRYTRVPFHKHSVLVPANPLDVIPPAWSCFVPVRNFGGPKRPERLQEVFDASHKKTEPSLNDHFLLCSILSQDDKDDSNTSLAITGFEEGKDVAIWVLSNFAGPDANTPFCQGSFQTDEGIMKNEDALSMVKECHTAVSLPIIVGSSKQGVMHLVGTIGIKNKDIEGLIDVMPEYLQDHVGTFKPSSSMMDEDAEKLMAKRWAKLTKRQRIRHEVLKSILDSYTDMTITTGAILVPSLTFANSGVVVCTPEVSPSSRSKKNTDRLALAAFQVFAATHIMKVHDSVTANGVIRVSSKGDDQLVGANVDEVQKFVNAKSKEIAQRVSATGKPANAEDLALSYFLGSISQRYVGTRNSLDAPPIYWCMFAGFVSWQQLAQIFAKTGGAFNAWDILATDENLEVVADDTSGITFGVMSGDGTDQVVAFGEDGKVAEKMIVGGEVVNMSPSMEQAQFCKNAIMAYIQTLGEKAIFDQFTGKKDLALSFAQAAFDDLVATTNNFDQAPNAALRKETRARLSCLMHDIAVAASKHSKLDDFITEIQRILKSDRTEGPQL
jgi:hypothetical protein